MSGWPCTSRLRCAHLSDSSEHYRRPQRPFIRTPTTLPGAPPSSTQAEAERNSQLERARRTRRPALQPGHLTPLRASESAAQRRSPPGPSRVVFSSPASGATATPLGRAAHRPPSTARPLTRKMTTGRTRSPWPSGWTPHAAIRELKRSVLSGYTRSAHPSTPDVGPAALFSTGNKISALFRRSHVARTAHLDRRAYATQASGSQDGRGAPQRGFLSRRGRSANE